MNISTTIKSFFDRQKRDLSDKSHEDNERKKARERESSSNVSLSLVKATRLYLKMKWNPHVMLVFYTVVWKIWEKVKRHF